MSFYFIIAGLSKVIRFLLWILDAMPCKGSASVNASYKDAVVIGKHEGFETLVISFAVVILRNGFGVSTNSCTQHPKFEYMIYILGNGPSAIALSYMLAGNTPVYSGTSNDEFLHLRLSEMPDHPIVLQDLKGLSEVSNKFLMKLYLHPTPQNVFSRVLGVKFW